MWSLKNMPSTWHRSQWHYHLRSRLQNSIPLLPTFPWFTRWDPMTFAFSRNPFLPHGRSVFLAISTQETDFAQQESCHLLSSELSQTFFSLDMHAPVSDRGLGMRMGRPWAWCLGWCLGVWWNSRFSCQVYPNSNPGCNNVLAVWPSANVLSQGPVS